MRKRVVLTILILVSMFPTVPVKAEPFTYFEYPTETWIIEKQDYFGQFLEWTFIPIEGQHGNKFTWNFTWTKRDYIEIYNDTTGDPITFYETPIPSILERLNDTDFLKEKYDELKELGGFTNQGDFISDCRRLGNYTVSIDPKDRRYFAGFPVAHIDILNKDCGWFTFTLKEWTLGIRITIGFGSTITYNGGTNTITVTGGTVGSPVDFWDIWNASDVNGWDVVHNNNETDIQFQFDAKLVIGDSVNPTWFADTNKQVYFTDSVLTANGQNLIEVKVNAHFTLGTLGNLTEKTVYDGCEIINGEASFYSWITNSAEANLYASQLIGNGYEGRTLLKNLNHVWGTSLLNGMALRNSFDAHSVNILSGYISNPTPTSIADEIYLSSFTTGQPALYIADIGSITNSKIHVNGDHLAEVTAVRGFNFIDCDTNKWTFKYSAAGTFNRKYTFNILVVDKDGNPIQNADVALTYSGQGGGTTYSDVTPANGSIPEQTISKGFYNQTGGDTIYPYEPYSLTVSALGYDTESFIFNISEPTSWVIGLRENVIDVEIVNAFNLELLLFAGLALIATLGAFLGSAIVGAIAGGFGLFLWYFTAQWWMIQQAGASTTVFAYVFYMLAIVSVFMAMKNVLEIYNEITRKGGYE